MLYTLAVNKVSQGMYHISYDFAKFVCKIFDFLAYLADDHGMKDYVYPMLEYTYHLYQVCYGTKSN